MTHSQLAKDLVYTYCESYGITPADLAKFNGRGRVRVKNGVHLDFLRMALSQYLYENFALYTEEIGSLIGYKDRSTMSANRRRITWYIESKDPYFYPYWEKLLELGELYKKDKDFFRTHNGFIRKKAA